MLPHTYKNMTDKNITNLTKKKRKLIIEEVIDLFSLNATIISSNIKDDYIVNLIKSKYIVSNDYTENIYNFIYSYIHGTKLLHQDYKYFDYSLYNSIILNKNIKIIWGDCLDKLKLFPSESVGLMCTSPPYYNARDYSTWNNLNDYLTFMTDIIKECYRVLDNHRVFVFNISDVVTKLLCEDIRRLWIYLRR